MPHIASLSLSQHCLFQRWLVCLFHCRIVLFTYLLLNDADWLDVFGCRRTWPSRSLVSKLWNFLMNFYVFRGAVVVFFFFGPHHISRLFSTTTAKKKSKVDTVGFTSLAFTVVISSSQRFFFFFWRWCFAKTAHEEGFFRVQKSTPMRELKSTHSHTHLRDDGTHTHNNNNITHTQQQQKRAV